MPAPAQQDSPSTDAATGHPVRRRHRNYRRPVTKTLWNIIGLAVAAVMVFPVYWMVSSSFKTGVNLRRVEPQWFPSPFTFDSYSRALDQPRFLTSLGNSLMVVTATALIALAIGFLAAVALARMNFSGRTSLIILVIAIQMVPIEGLIIPMYLMLNQAGPDRFGRRPDPGLPVLRAAVHRLDAPRLHRRGADRSRRGRHGRRLHARPGVPQDHPAAGRARSGRHCACSR